jgi:hypothetical protein
MKNAPKSAKKLSVMASDPPLKAGFLNSRRSSIGSGVRSSHQANAASTTAATPKQVRMSGSPHP